jgi:predicted amidohydrolase
MKVSVAQIECIPGDIEANCAQIPRLAEAAKANGCEVIVFPEMTDTGYEMSAIQKTASPWPELPFNTAKKASRDFAVYLICGLSEREGERIYNSLAVFDPEGNLIGKYRKTHLLPLDPVNENRYLTPGNSLEIAQIGDMKWGLLICYDLRFPEVSRQLIMKGAEALVVCAAWPFPRESHWQTLTKARAIENQCYVIAANRIGTDGPLTFCGSSRIINPDGTIEASASQDQQELLIAQIHRENVSSLRASMPFLENIL